MPNVSLRPACGIIFLTKILVVKMKEGSDDFTRTEYVGLW